MKNKIYVFFSLVLLSCLENTAYDIPEINCEESDFMATHTISQIKEMVGFGIRTFTDEIIISGYVTSSDEQGNIYKSIYLQDNFESPNSAVKIEIDLTNSYVKYAVGRKIFIRLKGLAISNVRGNISIGKAIGGNLERIPSNLIPEHFFRSCSSEEILPKKILISEINETHVGMLLQLEGVQFEVADSEKTFANTDSFETVELTMQQFTNECKSIGEIILQTSGFARFKSEKVPKGRGSVIGVLEKYYNNFHLLIRNSTDVSFLDDRCELKTGLSSNISVQDLFEMYKGSIVEFGVAKDLLLEAYVVSSDEEKNFENRIVLQDGVAYARKGIQVLIDQENYFESFSFGEKIYLKLNKLYLDKIDGALTLGVFKNNSVGAIKNEEMGNYIFQTDSIFDIIPAEFSLDELSSKNICDAFVAVKKVQLKKSELGKAFAYYSGEEMGTRILETCDVLENLSLVTNGKANFADNKFPEGNGIVKGVLTKNNGQFEMRINSEADIDFKDVFEDCPERNPQIIISEIADPHNESSARFVELLNTGDFSVNLSGWKLNKYINGAATVSSHGLSLNGVLKPGEFYIIGNTGFHGVFGFEPHVSSTYISGNGDDVYELLDSNGDRHDIYGIVGEDGSDKNWEYTDGKAERKTNFPTSIFDNSAWEIATKSKGNEKDAPEEFNPNQR